MLIYSLITARSGSKGIKDKNIIDYNGFPLIYHSIKISQDSKFIKRTFVSTDSEKYASICKSYDAEVPFIRPSNIAQDLSTDLEVFEHFINYLKEHNEILPDIILHLRPTYPNRNLILLNNCIETFKNNIHNYDSFRTVCSFDKLPQKMYYIENNTLTPYYKEYNGMKEPYNMPRQLFETSYIHNGCIDLIKTETITNLHSMSGNKIFPFIMNDIDDIDNIEDLEKSKKNYKKY
jgi:CMP-N,N'-diacetyllegionaminic acid synthase